MSTSPDECARLILETVPMVMRVIRSEMRSNNKSALSVPQFRVLIYLNRNTGASLSDVAEHMGLSLPAMSKMVDILVTRNLMTREIDSKDRRRMVLACTQLGHKLMQSAREATQASLSGRLASLQSSERGSVIRAMHSLKAIFNSSHQSKNEV